MVNTLNNPLVPVRCDANKKSKAKLILVVGTSMNSGKSHSAACCIWALSTMGHKVTAFKTTGTASLKDILLMEDSGAEAVADFSYLGYPSTYLLSEDDLMKVFYSLESKFGSHSGYLVVEIADGILQRETAMLLKNDYVRSRIHKLIFASHDALGAYGGVRILKDQYDLVPDAISGLCSSSPLALRELGDYIKLQHFDNMKKDLGEIAPILIDK